MNGRSLAAFAVHHSQLKLRKSGDGGIAIAHCRKVVPAAAAEMIPPRSWQYGIGLAPPVLVVLSTQGRRHLLLHRRLIAPRGSVNLGRFHARVGLRWWHRYRCLLPTITTTNILIARFHHTTPKSRWEGTTLFALRLLFAAGLHGRKLRSSSCICVGIAPTIVIVGQN